MGVGNYKCCKRDDPVVRGIEEELVHNESKQCITYNTYNIYQNIHVYGQQIEPFTFLSPQSEIPKSESSNTTQKQILNENIHEKDKDELKNNKENKQEKKEMHQDKKEMDLVKKEVEKDKKEMEKDKKEMEKDKKQIEKDKKEMEKNKKEMEKNKKEGTEKKVNKKKKKKKDEDIDEDDEMFEKSKKKLDDSYNLSYIPNLTNEIKEKVEQYRNMCDLNDFEQNIPTKKISKINIDNLDYKSEFNKFREYKYFKQKEEKFFQPEVVQQKKVKTKSIEDSYLQKIQQNKGEIKECQKEIAILALKQIFEQQGSQVFLKETLKFANKEEKIFEEKDESEQRYQDTANHLIQTGLENESYYSLPLKDDNTWNYEKASKNRKQYSQYFKKLICSQKKEIQNTDILILDIVKPQTVNFTCNKEISDITIQNKYYSSIPKQKIIQKLELSDDLFDFKFSRNWDNMKAKSNITGRINGVPQTYHFPIGYYGIGLNINGKNKYPDDGWFGSGDNDESWIVLFHKTKPDSVLNIIQEGLKSGPKQVHQYKQSLHDRGIVGQGTYFSDKIEFCKIYGKPLQLGNDEYELIFQCRVNPKTVKVPFDKERFYVSSEGKDSRPYRLLLKKL